MISNFHYEGSAEQRIAEEGFNLNISRYICTATAEEEIDPAATRANLTDLERSIRSATMKHNDFLKQLGLKPLPTHDDKLKE